MELSDDQKKAIAAGNISRKLSVHPETGNVVIHVYDQEWFLGQRSHPETDIIDDSLSILGLKLDRDFSKDRPDFEYGKPYEQPYVMTQSGIELLKAAGVSNPAFDALVGKKYSAAIKGNART